ncbi:metalloregulator ArsR/SmtB family transcription factor [Sandaracinobacter sp. RS1-74]|uniref:ArsR/SmtB family transcription factor n=1 Tax=Sandaracinobacteroides sayramensis TaxID=2913411 RepID=UPI001EDC1137|nr:metalloregulator ArsR/SmtB family transcription factor [Sandaracinobacteroides sayramensis]MCG2839857.1 metalloregulator ArsR/SmtB family transcription factor [Sandaracinobacteroides sayramensis]
MTAAALPADGELVPLGRDADRMARVLRLLANPDRLKMLCRMGMGEMDGGRRPTVGEMVGMTGLSQSRVSQHLALLREVGVVTPQREGQQVRYRLVDPRVRAVMEALCDLCEAGLPPSRLDALEPGDG